MIDQEQGSGGGAPLAPPIPSFESLRSTRRRSAIDLLVPPAEPLVAAAAQEPSVEESSVDERSVEEPAAGPRPAEWGDLLALGAWLGTRVTRLITAGAVRTLADLRTRLRG